MSALIIEVRGVSKAFGGVVANHEISLTVAARRDHRADRPQRFGQDDPVQLDRRLSPDRRGSIRFEGREISKLRVQQIARLGLLRTFQQTRIYGKMNCVQNMLISLPHRNAIGGDMFGRIRMRTSSAAETCWNSSGSMPNATCCSGDAVSSASRSCSSSPWR